METATITDLKQLIDFYFDIAPIEQILINDGKIYHESHKLILLHPTFILFTRSNMFHQHETGRNDITNESVTDSEPTIDSIMHNFENTFSSLYQVDNHQVNMNTDEIQSLNVNTTISTSGDPDNAASDNTATNENHTGADSDSTENTIIVSESDRAGVERLVDIGFSFHDSYMAYFISNRDENVAANLLFTLY